MQDCMGSLRNLAVPAPYRTTAKLSPTTLALLLWVGKAARHRSASAQPRASAFWALSSPGSATTTSRSRVGGPSALRMSHRMAPAPETRWSSTVRAPPSKVISKGHHWSFGSAVGLLHVAISVPGGIARAAVRVAQYCPHAPPANRRWPLHDFPAEGGATSVVLEPATPLGGRRRTCKRWGPLRV